VRCPKCRAEFPAPQQQAAGKAKHARGFSDRERAREAGRKSGEARRSKPQNGGGAAENAMLLQAIAAFVAESQWAANAWKEQPHIKRLFDIARTDAGRAKGSP